MTPAQAAEVIGCSPQQVRTLCRTGKLKCTQYVMPWDPKQYTYDIAPAVVRTYAATMPKGGWPRGKSRDRK